MVNYFFTVKTANVRDNSAKVSMRPYSGQMLKSPSSMPGRNTLDTGSTSEAPKLFGKALEN